MYMPADPSRDDNRKLNIRTCHDDQVDKDNSDDNTWCTLLSIDLNIIFVC